MSVPVLIAVDAIEAVLDLTALVVILAAVIRVVRLRPGTLTYGRWSKAGWIAAAVLLTWSLGPVAVPAGALFALLRTRRPRDPFGTNGGGGRHWQPKAG